jgi:hypothetical protein
MGSKDILGYAIEDGWLVEIWEKDGAAFMNDRTTYRTRLCLVTEAETRYPDKLRQARERG